MNIQVPMKTKKKTKKPNKKGLEKMLRRTHKTREVKFGFHYNEYNHTEQT